MFQTGIAFIEKSPSATVVMAVTWYKYAKPNFVTKVMNLPYMKENMASVIVTQGNDLVTTVNAACSRTIEHLLIKHLIVPSNPPQVELVTKPSLARKTFVLPVVKAKNHWLLTAAERALTDWLRGVR